MRDLLFLAHRIPYPPDKGDKIRSFHTLQHLSSRFRVRLGCFSDEKPGTDNLEQLRKICAEVFCLPLHRNEKITRALGALLKGASISEAAYRDHRMESWVGQKLSGGSIRDVFIFCSAMYPYIENYVRDLHAVIDMVDVDSQKWGDYAQFARWPMRMIYLREQRRLLDLERRAARSCDSSLFVSRAEADLFARLSPGTADKVDHMANGVDLERFDPAIEFSSPFPPDSLPIVFTGMMDYRPNVDAVTWFAREAVPAIRRDHEAAEFWIVGKNPAPSVRKLGRFTGVKVVGAVPDVRPYIANSRCVVAPLRIARGIQNKVLEAMAMAKPVVLTPAALEGLDIQPNRDALVAKTADDFARLVSHVLTGAQPQVGWDAHARVRSRYRWKANLGVLDKLFVNSVDPRDLPSNGTGIVP